MIIAPSTLTWIDVVQILVIPVLLPAIVGLATRWQPVGNLPTLAKRLILATLALASQLLTDLIQSAVNGTAYDLYGALFLGAVAILAAELSYQSLYKAPIVTTVPAEPVQVPITSSRAKAPLVATIEAAAPVTLASVIGGKHRA